MIWRKVSAVTCALALSALALVGGTLATQSARAATSMCTVSYSLTNSWPGGFQAGISITNNGPALTSWALAFTFPNDQTVSNGWSATFTQNGQDVTAASESYNGALATGASVSIGFVGAVAPSTARPRISPSTATRATARRRCPRSSSPAPARTPATRRAPASPSTRPRASRPPRSPRWRYWRSALPGAPATRRCSPQKRPARTTSPGPTCGRLLHPDRGGIRQQREQRNLGADHDQRGADDVHRAEASGFRRQAGHHRWQRRWCCTAWTGRAPSTSACRATGSSTARTPRRRSRR